MNKITLPAGKYWIGDPCYIFPNSGPMSEKWDEMIDRCDFNNGELIELDEGKIRLWASYTSYGDGVYIGSNNKHFPVDAGLMGIATQQTVNYLNRKDNHLESLGLFIEFTEPFIVQCNAGIFNFGHIEINTDYDDV